MGRGGGAGEEGGAGAEEVEVAVRPPREGGAGGAGRGAAEEGAGGAGGQDVSFWDIAWTYFPLGWTAFGGPAAHIATFEQTFVRRLGWLPGEVFTEFMALGQCLPGPTSTQMAFAMGTVKRGVPGGLLGGFMFLHPGLIMMTAIGAATGGYLNDMPAVAIAVVAGLTAVAIALVASAGLKLSAKICRDDKLLIVICAVSTFCTVYSQPSWLLPVVMLFGGLSTLISNTYRLELKRRPKLQVTCKKIDFEEAPDSEGTDKIKSLGLPLWGGGVLVGVWLVILVAVLVVVATVPQDKLWEPIRWFAIFYRAGSLIFGGGQVLLPLLQDEVAPCVQIMAAAEGAAVDASLASAGSCLPAPGALMTSEQFFLGLAAAQAMPGPLFNFSAYLGAVIAMNAGYFFLLGTAVCWVGLFSPGIMLIFGILPFWGWFRRLALVRKMLPGINAAAVGLIFAAVFRLGLTAYDTSPFPRASNSIGVAGFTLVHHLGVPAPLAILGGGVLGIISWAIGLN